MAAACDVEGEQQEQTTVNEELLEAQIVAQAITELQEIQAPNTQSSSQNTIDPNLLTSLTTAVAEAGEDVPGQTHVIYYIEDGTVVGSAEDKKLVDTSVQANDYDIERRSGRLPARRRVIPTKFRDYRNTSDPESSDSDFDPHDYVKFKRPRIKKEAIVKPDDQKPVKTNKPAKVRVKRSYPTMPPAEPDPATEEKLASIEEKYQMAIKMAAEEQAKRRAEMSMTNSNSEEPGADKSVLVKQEREEKGVQDEESMEDTEIPLPFRRGPGRPRGPDWGSEFRCPDCGKVFKIKGNLRAHLRTHAKVMMFPCTEENCGKSFSSNESLRRHTMSHQGIKPFECDICNKFFSSNVALTEHKTRHFDEKPYHCQQCGKQMRHVSSYKRHMMTHSSELPFECNICHKRFAQAPYLRSHMKVHTGEKPYKCPMCDKRFAYQSDVKRHRTTHTGEKPYQCSKCNARFSDASSRARHEREHANSKRFTCSLCNDTFKRSGQLRSHLSRKHNQSAVTIKLKDPNSVPISVRLASPMELNPDNLSQQRIVSLIKSLHSKTTPAQGAVDMDNISLLEITENSNQATEIAMDTGRGTTDVIDIGSLDKEVGPIELQGVEIQGTDDQQTYVTITGLADALSSAEGENTNVSEMKYRVVYEVDFNGKQRQLLIPFDGDESEALELDYSGTNLIATNELEITGATETIVESMQDTGEGLEEVIDYNSQIVQDPVVDQQNENGNDSIKVTDGGIETEVAGELSESVTANKVTSASEGLDASNIETSDMSEVFGVGSGIDFVNNPDFSKQEYYNWLTNFTDVCKVVSMPLEASLFQKISQVHKTVSDVMATPSGVVADRENFIVLMNITKELSSIINEHLMYVMQNLGKVVEEEDIPIENCM